MRSLKILTVTLLLTGAMPMFGAIYMKFDGIDGDVTAAGHEKWIEISSTQMLDQGRVRISSSSLAKLDNLCQSRRPLGDVLLDVDGKRQVLKNARFAECPTSRGGVATAVLAFEPTFRGGVFVAAGDVNGDGGTQISGRITGVAVDPMPIRLESLKLNPNGTSAKAVFGQPVTFTATVTAPLPQVVIELANGSKWTFTNLTFRDIVVSGATTQMTLNFTKVVFKQAPMSGK